MLALLLVLLPSVANATEIATSKKIGLGLATGYPYLGLTAKYYINDKSGFAGYLGNAGALQNLRVVYQHELAELENWSWSRLPLYWQAGADVGVWTTSYGYTGARLGVLGGAGASLQFHKIPLELFVELGVEIAPINGLCTQSNRSACWLQFANEDGARWYF